LASGATEKNFVCLNFLRRKSTNFEGHFLFRRKDQRQKKRKDFVKCFDTFAEILKEQAWENQPFF